MRFEKPLPLQALIAYSEQGTVLDLTSRVGASGQLDWTAPAGAWTLYALFQGWHGKQVERAGPGGEGDVVDHFSKMATQHYLQRFDQAFRGRDVRGIRAFFNDSYEVDDAQGEANWTPLMFSEFQRRRGYDLRQHLPALFGKASADQNARVLTQLDSWTRLSGEAGLKFAGTATYTTTFARPASPAAGYLLDLGRVGQSARVQLNGQDVATLIGPAYQVYLPGSQPKK